MHLSLQSGLKMMATQRIWLCEQESGEILACHFIKNPETLVANKSSWSWNSRKTSRGRTSRIASRI